MIPANNMRRALRISLLAVAVGTLAGATSERAAAEDRAASFSERWPERMPVSWGEPTSSQWICGGMPLHQYELPKGDDEETQLRKQRARIRAILAADS